MQLDGEHTARQKGRSGEPIANRKVLISCISILYKEIQITILVVNTPLLRYTVCASIAAKLEEKNKI